MTCALLRAGLVPALGLACYRHVPTTLEQVSPGDYVRAVIVADRSDASAARGVREVRTIRGTVAERESGQIVFSVANRSGPTPASGPVYQRIRVVEGDVLRVDRRRLDGKRTGAFVAMVVGAAVVATITGSRVVGGGPDQSPAPLDDSLRGILHRSCCR